MKKRLDYLDMAKGIGMLLVLLGHLQGDQMFALSPYIYPLCVFIFSFHMPMFFIISGILIAIKGDDVKSSFKELAKKRFKGIMIPYLWFSFFYIMVVVVALVKGTVMPETLYVNLWYVLSGYGMNVLWFLPAIYLGELLFFYLKDKIKTDKVFITVVTIASAVIFVIAYMLTKIPTDVEAYKRIREFATVLIRPVLACGFISLGYYIHKLCMNSNKIGDFFLRPKQDENGKVLISYRISYIVVGIILMGVCAGFKNVNSGIDFRSMVFRNVFFFLLCCISGSYGLIILCKGLPRIKLFTYWGVGSLIFMATHNSETVLYYAMKTAMYVNQYLTRARGYICYAIIVGIILIYTTAMIFIIQKFFPFIIGKSYKKNNA